MPQRSPAENTNDEKLLQTEATTFRFHEMILDASRLALVTTTPEGVITGFNRAAEELLLYKESELAGTATALIFHDANEIISRAEKIGQTAIDPGEAFDVLIGKAFTGNNPDRNEWTFIRKDGTRFTGSLTVTPVRDSANRLTGYTGIITDLTEVHDLKQQVAISEQKFKLLADHISGAVYLCRNDPSYSVMYVNDHVLEITGYPKEDFLTNKVTFSKLFHPDESAMIRDTINAAVANRASYALQYRINHASGDWRWVHETGIGVYEGDRLTMLEGFIQDITSQKAAEDKLLKSAEENLRFFNNPVSLNAVADFDARLVRISPSWTKMLGWSEDELQSQPVFNFIHAADLPRAQEEFNCLSKSNQVQTFENRLTCKDGSYRWLLWALAPDPDTRLIYISAIDISERKKSEENILDSKSNLEGITLQLQEQNRRLDEFAHIISHNLRSPVNNIQALIKLLNDESELTDYKLIYDKLKNVAKNLSETMNELMDTLKVRTQAQQDLTEIRFKEVLDKVVQSLEGELILAQASVTYDFNEAPVIQYVKPYLESIFQNLMTNAVKYKSMNRKPTIHFRSTIVNNKVELHVSDNGQGIDMEKFGDKLFGLHKTFHNHQEARGVGLFLVKTQIEALGGSISAKSEVDKGTTFIIRFN